MIRLFLINERIWNFWSDEYFLFTVRESESFRVYVCLMSDTNKQKRSIFGRDESEDGGKSIMLASPITHKINSILMDTRGPKRLKNIEPKFRHVQFSISYLCWLVSMIIYILRFIPLFSRSPSLFAFFSDKRTDKQAQKKMDSEAKAFLFFLRTRQIK